HSLRGHALLKVPVGNNSALFNSGGMSSNSTNEWSLLKEEFDALVRNEGGREESLEQLLDYQVRRRIGELIASSRGRQAAGYYGAWTESKATILKSQTYHFHRLDLTHQAGFFIVTIYDEDGLRLAPTPPLPTPEQAFVEARKIVDNKVEGPRKE